jgi:hypothetical protein
MGEVDAHPDLLQLEEVRSGAPVEPADAVHVASCPRCQSAIAELAAVAAGLQRLHRPVLEFAQARDDRILELARARAAQTRVDTPPARRWLSAAARWTVAIIAVLGVLSVLILRRQQTHQPQPLIQVAPGPPVAPAASAAVADLDGDGRVTVLDALVLARAIEAGHQNPAYDVNRDGRVDDDDVNAVLALAVSVGST